MSEGSEEINFYRDGDVFISNTRAIMGGEAYSIANITSVGYYKTSPSKTIGMVALLVGLMSLLMFLPAISGDGGFTSVGTSIFITIVSFVVAYFGLFRLNPTYVVRIGSASGEVDGVSSTDEASIRKIVEAMNTAIVNTAKP